MGAGGAGSVGRLSLIGAGGQRGMAPHKHFLLGGSVVLAFAVALVAVLCGYEAIPYAHETTPQYITRLWARSSAAVTDVWLQTLSLVPGAAQASVGPASSRASSSMSPSGSVPQKNIHDTLKQPVAKDHREIRAQQEVHVQRQVEAMRQRPDEAVLPDHPDEVRGRMEPVDPEGPEMRCGRPISPQSSVTTRDIEVRAKATYRGNRGGAHAWKYVITFVNHGAETVQMLTRHWLFVDSLGNLESEVKGPGARGVTPVLPPGGEWSYESGASLPTPHGSMHGSFQMEVLQGDTSSTAKRAFSARVGRVLLTSETERTPRRVPCAGGAAEELLPLTSVFSTERVILGASADYVGRKGSGTGDYAFQYDVQFNNARDAPVEVVEHTWTVVDSNGNSRVVSGGPGVGGIMGSRRHILAAGSAFRVQGEIRSPTPEANAQGMYQVIINGDDGGSHEIQARTDFMGITAKRATTQVKNFVVDPRFL